MNVTSGRSVLIVTAKFDPHADQVIEILKARGIPFFRLNTDDFHQDYQVAADDTFSIVFRDARGRTHVYPDQTRAVWHRKPVEPALPKAIADTPAGGIVAQETSEFLGYPSAIAAGRWVNNPLANLRAQRKFPQLRRARALGLRVPRTLITNDPDRALRFRQEVEGALLCKSMKAQSFEEHGRASFLFSRKVEAAELEANIEQIRHCPTFLQEYIEKDYELRVTLIGERVFACRIDSQAVAGARSDWRQVDPFKVPHAMVSLDSGVEAALTAMVRDAGLLYGAFDLIVTPDGEYVFLELNPNGQYLWIELITGAPLSAAMADLLAA